MDNQMPRQKVQGNWKCGKCGAAITELPFEPSPNRLGDLLCKDCYRERRDQFKSRGM